MNMIPVVSSNISSIGYEDNVLYISFNLGGLYAYYDVPRSVYDALMNASSHGKFFAENIKNTYRYNRID